MLRWKTLPSCTFPHEGPFKPTTVAGWLTHLDTWEDKLAGGMSVERAINSTYRKTQPRRNEIPKSVKEEVTEELITDAKAYGETTTDAVRQMFEKRGVLIKDGALYRFRHDLAWSLLTVTPNPRRESELGPENEARTKGLLLDFFGMIERCRTEHGIKAANIISFDEKPMWAERHTQKIWRKKGKVLGKRSRARVNGMRKTKPR